MAAGFATEKVLVGDVGGTNVRFALGHHDAQGRVVINNVTKLRGDDFSGFDAAVESYLSTLDTEQKPMRALFAMAGPVRNNRVRLTNRAGWDVSGPDLAAHFGLAEVLVVNDFAAMARAMPELPDSAFHEIIDGRAEAGAPVLVSGPGTGVGMATLLPMPGGRWRVMTGEGGHASYAPGNERESALVDELRRRHGYVSRELALSGSGMDLVMQAIAALDGVPFVPRTPAQVLELAAAGDPTCVEVCEMRAGGLMQMLGDATLTMGARGCVVITGGVAERLIDWVRAPKALDRFFQRGPMSGYMRDIPVRMIAEPMAALYGAAALLFEH